MDVSLFCFQFSKHTIEEERSRRDRYHLGHLCLLKWFEDSPGTRTGGRQESPSQCSAAYRQEMNEASPHAGQVMMNHKVEMLLPKKCALTSKSSVNLGSPEHPMRKDVGTTIDAKQQQIPMTLHRTSNARFKIKVGIGFGCNCC